MKFMEFLEKRADIHTKVLLYEASSMCGCCKVTSNIEVLCNVVDKMRILSTKSYSLQRGY